MKTNKTIRPTNYKSFTFFLSSSKRTPVKDYFRQGCNRICYVLARSDARLGASWCKETTSHSNKSIKIPRDAESNGLSDTGRLLWHSWNLTWTAALKRPCCVSEEKDRACSQKKAFLRWDQRNIRHTNTLTHRRTDTIRTFAQSMARFFCVDVREGNKINSSSEKTKHG